MAVGDTAPDNSVSGYVRSEQIVLTITEPSSSFAWAMSRPAGSTAASDLSDAAASGPTFVPEVGGLWLVTVTTDATVYTLRISVQDVANIATTDTVRLSPVEAATVPTPALGFSLFTNADTGLLSVKNSSGVVQTVNLT